MNRSWFRNPFSSSATDARSGHGEADGLDVYGDGQDVDHEAVALVGSKSGRRRRRRQKSDRTGTSDTSAKTNTSATSYSNSSVGNETGAGRFFHASDTEPVPPLPEFPSHLVASQAAEAALPAQSTSHNHAPSLHSISSIRTAHFAQIARATQSPDGSTEASPSKTPIKDRLSRFSWASTASGMVNFDDGDREEAEKRWHEGEDAQEGDVDSEGEGGDKWQGARQERDDARSDGNDGRGASERSFTSNLARSRSSTSLKSILKKSVSAAVEVAMGSTPHRTVTFSPSTAPAAASPPETTVTPEHPRLLFGDKRQSNLDDSAASPTLHSYVEDASLLGSNDSREVEEALVSRSSISPTGGSHNASTDSLRLQGLASQRGSGFMDRMQAFIPSPDTSYTQVSPHPSNARSMPQLQEVSNLLDTSAPSHVEDATVTDERSRLRFSIGPKPLLLRRSMLHEEPVTQADSGPNVSVLLPNDTIAKGPSTVPTASPADPVGAWDTTSQSPVLAPPDTYARTPMREVQGDGQDSVFYTPAAEPLEESSSLSESRMRSALLKTPLLTPSSSASSVALVNPDSPFSSLVSHLLSAQDELLSHRADQKTLLLSLITNLRGELAARDSTLNALEKRKVSLECKLRQEQADRAADRTDERTRLQAALGQMEETRAKIAIEVQRRDTAMREELVHEKAKREMAEARLQELQRSDLDAASAAAMQRKLAEQQSLLAAAQQAQDSSLRQAEEVRAHALSQQREQEERCADLEEQLCAAEMHITRLSANADQQHHSLLERQREVQELESQRDQGLADAAQQQERFTVREQELLRSLHESRNQQEQTQREREELKRESAQLLQQRNQHISSLESEILTRSAARRKVMSNGCSSCADMQERAIFLEGEIVRLRESVSRMRMESSDREVKVARLTKQRDQLQEDVDGLNIALEAKQQELRLLKRASGEIVNGGTVRTANRTMRSRPSSMTQDSILKSSIASVAINRQRQDSRRISFQQQPQETPSIGAPFLTSTARQQPTFRPHKGTSKALDKALAAASLYSADGDGKENDQHRRADMPSVPTSQPGQREHRAMRQSSAVPMHV